MTGERAASVLTLKDGRRLGYAEYGDPLGKPLLFFHGMPGSRVEGKLGDAAARKLGIRLIAPDRPGYGLSDFKPKRTFLDWPEDVTELADELGIDRFAVAGISGGGPYAAVCALKLAERVPAAGIISGIGPFTERDATVGMSRQNRTMLGLARRALWLVRPPLWLMGQLGRRVPDWAISQMARAIPEADRALLSRPEIRFVFREDLTEAFRQGTRGAAWEALMYTRPWGFSLEEIVMKVHLWQGEADVNVPPSMARYQARAIPNCAATFYPGEGHLCSLDRMEEILASLA